MFTISVIRKNHKIAYTYNIKNVENISLYKSIMSEDIIVNNVTFSILNDIVICMIDDDNIIIKIINNNEIFNIDSMIAKLNLFLTTYYEKNVKEFNIKSIDFVDLKSYFTNYSDFSSTLSYNNDYIKININLGEITFKFKISQCVNIMDLLNTKLPKTNRVINTYFNNKEVFKKDLDQYHVPYYLNAILNNNTLTTVNKFNTMFKYYNSSIIERYVELDRSYKSEYDEFNNVVSNFKIPNLNIKKSYSGLVVKFDNRLEFDLPIKFMITRIPEYNFYNDRKFAFAWIYDHLNEFYTDIKVFNLENL